MEVKNYQFNFKLNPRQALINTLMGEITNYCYSYFKGLDYLPALTPITTNAVSSPMGKGSDSLPVKIKLFGEETYLADSMQFHLEYLLRLHAPGVWYVMPTFRGEDPDSRHLNQFFHIESELLGDLNSVMSVVEGLIKGSVANILQAFSTKFHDLRRSIEHLQALEKIQKFNIVEYKDFKKKFGSQKTFFKVFDDGSSAISNEGEKKLTEWVGSPCWLKYPESSTVPFYQAKSPDQRYAMCADLILGGQEVVGCGERHFNDLETLKALKEHEVEPDSYQWYIEMKRLAPLKTSGFGLGLERFIGWIIMEDDIRKIATFSRLKNEPIYP